MPSGLDKVHLAELVCTGKKFNSMPNWGCMAGIADELGGMKATDYEVCEEDA